MKIYFEDGILRPSAQLPIAQYIVISAASGVSTNLRVLDDLMDFAPDATVYTNSIFAFNNKYAWN